MTIAQAVDQLIAQYPFLEESLSEGLINVSALARRLKPDIESILKKEVQEGAIIMAINRRPPGSALKISREIKAFMSKLGDIIVRSDLSDYTFENSPSLSSCHRRLMEERSTEQQVLYTVSQGVYETTVVVSNILDPLVKDFFSREKILARKSDLSSITIRLPENNTELSGIYYFLLKNLAWAGINVCEVISTSNEITFVVSEHDVHKAFTILMDLKRKG